MVYGGAATIDKVDSDILHKMQSFISSSNIFISNHAGARMFERGVSADDLITLITNGEIIEEYHDEYRCPAVLMLGPVRGIPHHIVVAICKDQLIIVTVYLPNEDEWSIIGGGNKMGPGECLLCRSKMREGTTEFIARVGGQVVVIKNIPAFVCPNCDEAYYSIDIQRKIDRIMKAFHEGKLLAKTLAAGEVDLLALDACQPYARAAIGDL